MPTKATAYKAVRQTAKRTERNRQRKRTIHEVVKAALQAIVNNEAEAAVKAKRAYQAIDKAVQKGTLHPNTGARKKARLMKRLNFAKK